MRRSGRKSNPPARYSPEDFSTDESDPETEVCTSATPSDSTGSLADFIASDDEPTIDILQQYQNFVRTLLCGCEQDRIETFLSSIENATLDTQSFSGLLLNRS